MTKQMGTRCPECGTKDAPWKHEYLNTHGDTEILLECPRCMHEGFARRASRDTAKYCAIAAFYGPQEEPESKELLRCRCGGKADLSYYEDSEKWDVACETSSRLDDGNCCACTPEFPTAAEARACWRRMMEE